MLAGIVGERVTMKAPRYLTCSFAALLGLTGQAAAADLLAPEQTEFTTESGWEFAFAPYVWAAGLDGDIAQFGLPAVEVDLSFTDILKHFDIGFMGAGEARYGRLAFLTDLLYVKLSADDEVEARRVKADISLTTEVLTILGTAEYRLIDAEGGTLDALAGARVWWVKTDLDFSGNFIDASGSDSATWVDPIIGVRGRLNLGPEFFLTSWAMIGGFGVSSELTWDLMGALGYQASDSVSLIAGYRGLSVDYEDDGFVFDVVQQGPILGAVIRF